MCLTISFLTSPLSLLTSLLSVTVHRTGMTKSYHYNNYNINLLPEVERSR